MRKVNLLRAHPVVKATLAFPFPFKGQQNGTPALPGQSDGSASETFGGGRSPSRGVGFGTGEGAAKTTESAPRMMKTDRMVNRRDVEN